MSFQSFYALKLFILICASLPHTDNVKESFYGKRFTTKDLLLANLTKNLNRYIIVNSNLNLIDSRHVLNILLISNEKELE